MSKSSPPIPLHSKRRRQGAGAVVGGGALAGLIAGAVTMAVALAWNNGLGAGLLARGSAAAVAGPMALVGGSGTLAAGWALALLQATILGLIYTSIGWTVRRYRTALIWGVLFSIAVWFGFGHWLLPHYDPVLAAYSGLLGATWLGLHIIYGVVLSVSAPIRRGLAGGPQAVASAWEMPKAS